MMGITKTMAAATKRVPPKKALVLGKRVLKIKAPAKTAMSSKTAKNPKSFPKKTQCQTFKCYQCTEIYPARSL